MKTLILIAGLCALAVTQSSVVASAIVWRNVTISDFNASYNRSEFKAGVEGQIGDSFQANHNVLKEVGLLGPSNPSTPSWMPTDNFVFGSISTHVRLDWDLSNLMLNIGDGALVLTRPTTLFDKLFIALDSSVFGDSYVRISNVRLNDLTLFGSLTSSGSFKGIEFTNFSSSTPGSLELDLVMAPGTGQPPVGSSSRINIVAANAPEPGSAALLSLALAVFGGSRRKRP